MAKGHKQVAAQMHDAAQATARGIPWPRHGLRFLGAAGVLLGGGSLLSSVLPLPEFVNQIIGWYQATAHPAIAGAISSVLGGGFIANWTADAAVTAAGTALLGLARRSKR